MSNKPHYPHWWPTCPYPETIFPMKMDEYEKAVPSERTRTALSGMLGRHFWNIASEVIFEAMKETERTPRTTVEPVYKRPVNVQCVARLLHVPVKWVKEEAERGTIPHIQINGKLFFKLDLVENAILSMIEPKTEQSSVTPPKTT